MLCSRETPTEALVNLLQRSSATPGDLSDLDIETTTLALQSLELLVIESPTLMTNQVFFQFKTCLNPDLLVVFKDTYLSKTC